MPTRKVIFLDKKVVAESTMEFSFRKPDGFTFRAGQHIDMTLTIENVDKEGNQRSFSLASAPYEDSLKIATRIRETSFKKTLSALSSNAEVEIDGPFGSFFLHSDISKPAIFLAGGIGITPMRSMILDATQRKLPHKLALLYSNRRPEDAAYLEEFKILAKENENFIFFPTMTNLENSKEKWTGEKGYIDKTMIQKIPGYETAIYYISGPPQMVAALRTMLLDAKINEDNIRTEEFAGY